MRGWFGGLWTIAEQSIDIGLQRLRNGAKQGS